MSFLNFLDNTIELLTVLDIYVGLCGNGFIQKNNFKVYVSIDSKIEVELRHLVTSISNV